MYLETIRTKEWNGCQLTAKYGSLHAAQSKLGSVEDIQSTFVEFSQKHLYDEAS